ncbi:MAG: (Fe-S)-binding protein, partial [Proteobacteria bacterium]|nr:(Fe-S)-binding protein [Pseudomonadota bacterium]
RLFGSLAGARDLTEDVVKEWFYYFYQCTECRRCSIFCPFGIDTAEVTMIMRELLISIGVGTHWITEPAAKCFRVSNHLGIAPHALRDGLEFARDELRDITGLDIEIPISRKGAEVLFVMPSADYFATPHYYTLLGYMMLFHEIGLDYTVSAYASEGGNFGLFHSNDLMKGLNAKIYDEAKRLGVKWILGGECGHMWRVLHQYMDTMNGPADFLEVPVSPITGTRFEHAASTRAVHICEFTADLIHHGKLRLNPARNDEYIVTFHDSCNPARAMGLLEEPRHVLKHVCNRFHEMAANTIREYTFCCGSGAGIGNDESLEIRLRGGFPRAVAVRQVREEHGVNLLACICAIDKATLPTAMDYWVPGVQVAGVHELLGNALVMRGEKERTTNLRGEPLAKEAANA